MIDITIDNNQIEVENKIYHSFNDKNNLKDAILDIINKAKYSGESISLWIADGEMKNCVERW